MSVFTGINILHFVCPWLHVTALFYSELSWEKKNISFKAWKYPSFFHFVLTRLYPPLYSSVCVCLTAWGFRSRIPPSLGLSSRTISSSCGPCSALVFVSQFTWLVTTMKTVTLGKCFSDHLDSRWSGLGKWASCPVNIEWVLLCAGCFLKSLFWSWFHLLLPAALSGGHCARFEDGESEAQTNKATHWCLVVSLVMELRFVFILFSPKSTLLTIHIFLLWS